MQLPGMATDPVRLSLDASWWPHDDTYGISRRLWLQDLATGQWILQDMRTTGTPLRHHEFVDQWRSAAGKVTPWFEELRSSHDFDPFT